MNIYRPMDKKERAYLLEYYRQAAAGYLIGLGIVGIALLTFTIVSAKDADFSVPTMNVIRIVFAAMFSALLFLHLGARRKVIYLRSRM